MAIVIRTIRRLFGKPPAPGVGPVTVAIRAMRAADWADRAESLRREIEATSSDDRAMVHLSALRALISESGELAGVNS
ncbi:hypothetical protein [Methylobacterium sp. Leaf361]|uniref:hypothetical protein n=1 Tax=Methylobacterium sp. Leaf361 TaxID=1736352 RepID=UPI000A4C713A|nr:hypothetical protein [Methylobacterium sp. Leaf361]